MLARLKSAPATDFEKLLVVPQRPPSIAEAEAALRNATAAREEGQQRHIEAGRRLQNQPLGQPPSITHAEVEELGQALAPLFEAEAAAKARRDEAVRAYEASIAPALAEPIAQLREAIEESIENLERLLGYGAAFRARAGSLDLAKISRLPGVCAPAIERLRLVRAALQHADRN
ncbi:hypothetical protein EOA13_21255 [Mesorhizobium sp. M7A.F.Ca.US.011.01.1.1]|uniref:hypothetical protein n=1 Tax=Mesorhizobium sp. M7A.F.Ca.US.011.01.1.1 TaxID=2496741 RepID=UPI000FCA2795|nr:hypothetical protein [Mesorhizobium sp. M7A.F.Ca.US.011.01.1.1]RUX27245.1 hypothetical protein EOA13_21255 [Mesorhizobium sp. M7A.F.Ca.US.011.01.1.1]